MVKMRHLFLVGIILAAGFMIVSYLSGSEEKQVKTQFSHLSEMVSKERDEGLITTAQKMQKIGTLFDKQCELRTHLNDLSGVYTPEEIVSHGARGRAQFSKFSLRFSDLKVEFPEEGLAKVTFTLRASGMLTHGQQVDEIHEVESTLRKIEKKWLFSGFQFMEVLKR